LATAGSAAASLRGGVDARRLAASGVLGTISLACAGDDANGLFQGKAWKINSTTFEARAVTPATGSGRRRRPGRDPSVPPADHGPVGDHALCSSTTRQFRFDPASTTRDHALLLARLQTGRHEPEQRSADRQAITS